MLLELIRNNIEREIPFFTPPIIFNANENRPFLNYNTTQSRLPRRTRQEKDCLDQESWPHHFTEMPAATPLMKVATVPPLVGQGSMIGINDQIEILKAALNKHDPVGAPDDAWQMISTTIKKLDLRNRQGKEWFIPVAGDPHYRQAPQGGVILRLIGHRVVIKNNGSFRIDEFRKNGMIAIFQKTGLS